MSFEMNQLSRKLQTHERVILELFDASPQSIVLKEKLSELQVEVANIPSGVDGVDALYEEWSEKITRWWRQFVTVPMECNRSILTDHGLQYEKSKSIHSNVDNHILSNSSSVSTSDLLDLSTIYSSDAIQYSNDEPQNRIQREFYHLPDVINCSDHTELRKLYEAVRKARGIINYFPNNFYLQKVLFNLAFSKLSTESRRLYCLLYDRRQEKRNIRDLHRFIADEFSGHYYSRTNHLNVIQLRRTIETDFGRLPNVKNCDDIDALKSLLNTLAKVRIMTFPHWRNSLLLSNVFDIVFVKLPEEIRDQYFKMDSDLGPKQHKSLASLNRLLVDQVANYYRGRNSANQTVDTKETQMCNYCKQIGHFLNGCTKLNQRVCFKCFRLGHKAIDCDLVDAKLYWQVEETRCFACNQTGHTSMQCLNGKCDDSTSVHVSN